jgi:Flp pilus assembly protein TadD
LSVLLGDILMMRGDCAAAGAAYKEGLAHAPRQVHALFGLAFALHFEGDFAQAAEIFQRIVTISPADAGARIGLGVCLLELGQPDAAFDSFRTAARSNAEMYGDALRTLSASRGGRFWLRPSDAERFLRGEKP